MKKMEIFETWRFAGGPHHTVGLTAEPSEDWLTEFAPLAERGVGLSFFNPDLVKRDVSLSFLEPIIESLQFLEITTVDEVRDLHVLEGATALRGLVLHCAGKLGVDLAALPHLQTYQGKLTRASSSVLANPSLRELEVVGRVPKSAPVVRGKVREYRHIGGGRAFLDLAHPESVKTLERAGASSFDLQQLESFTSLETLRVERCPHVTNLWALDTMARLRSVIFQSCTTPESWEGLTAGYVLLTGEKPRVSYEFALAARERGWVLDGKIDAEGNLLRWD